MNISLENISVRFGQVQALSNVDLTAGNGEIVMLVGPNGAGKSTLLKVLLGLVRPDTGTIKIDEKLRRIDNSVKRLLGYLPEAVAFSENLTGRQILAFFARARKTPKARIAVVLERVGLLNAAKRAVRGYSRGMRQRLGLAVAILAEPQLLILDEPTGGLDQEGLGVLWSILKEWKQKNRVVMISSHDIAALERRIDTMCVLKKGRVVSFGTPQQLREQVSLPHFVRLFPAPTANGAVEQMRSAISDWDKGTLGGDDEHLSVALHGDDLLDFLSTHGQFLKNLSQIRIEEPSLEAIYERLLEDR